MTTQPGCVASGTGGDACSAKPGAPSRRRTAVMQTHKDPGTSLKSMCGVRCDGCDVLMENASHSYEFLGIEIAQPVGTAVRWGTNFFREQKSGRQACPAFGPLVVAHTKNEVAGFLAQYFVRIRASISLKLTLVDAKNHLAVSHASALCHAERSPSPGTAGMRLSLASMNGGFPRRWELPFFNYQLTKLPTHQVN